MADALLFLEFMAHEPVYTQVLFHQFLKKKGNVISSGELRSLSYDLYFFFSPTKNKLINV